MGNSKKLPAIASALLLVSAMACHAPQAQSTPGPLVPAWQTAAGGKMTFEAASLKRSEPDAPFESNVSLDGLDGPPAGNLFKANAPLMAYVRFAYKITDSDQVRGIYDTLPRWARAPLSFDIEARAGGTPTRDQLRLMVQALLEGRFKLASHWEARPNEEPSFVLTRPEKPDQQFEPHRTGKPCVNKSSGSPTIEAPGKDTEALRYCGVVTWRKDGQQYVRMSSLTLPQMIQYLQSGAMEEVPVNPYATVDGTGQTDLFDLDLQFVPGGNESGSKPYASGPILIEAIGKQFSLRFVYRKVQMETLIIDHLEKPVLD
jgi:uncharacterized protein (TIGR03435 family)